MSGWIKLHRKVLESPYWLSEQFTRGQAWIDLLLLANREPGFVRKQGIRIDLERGDIGWSEVELSARWGWSRGKVRRFFDELEKDGMISRKNGTETDRRKFAITICKYNEYQDCKTGDDTGDRTSDGQATGQATVQEQEVKKLEKDIGEINSPEEKPKKKRKLFIPPSLEEVKAYCIERKNSVNAEKWHDWYQSKGWKVGKNKMADWKAAVRTWEDGDKNAPTQGKQQKSCDYFLRGTCSRNESLCAECGSFKVAA